MSKLASRVFTTLRLRPAIDKEDTSNIEPTNGLAGHDHSDLPPRPPPRSKIGLTSTHVDPTTAHLDTASTLSDRISSDDAAHQAVDHQRCETAKKLFLFLNK